MLSCEGNCFRLPLTDECFDDSEEVLSFTLDPIDCEEHVASMPRTQKTHVQRRFDVLDLPRHQRFREVDLSIPQLCQEC